MLDISGKMDAVETGQARSEMPYPEYLFISLCLCVRDCLVLVNIVSPAEERKGRVEMFD